jgi:hypothetical protein
MLYPSPRCAFIPRCQTQHDLPSRCALHFLSNIARVYQYSSLPSQRDVDNIWAMQHHSLSSLRASLQASLPLSPFLSSAHALLFPPPRHPCEQRHCLSTRLFRIIPLHLPLTSAPAQDLNVNSCLKTHGIHAPTNLTRDETGAELFNPFNVGTHFSMRAGGPKDWYRNCALDLRYFQFLPYHTIPYQTDQHCAVPSTIGEPHPQIDDPPVDDGCANTPGSPTPHEISDPCRLTAVVEFGSPPTLSIHTISTSCLVPPLKFPRCDEFSSVYLVDCRLPPALLVVQAKAIFGVCL